MYKGSAWERPREKNKAIFILTWSWLAGSQTLSIGCSGKSLSSLSAFVVRVFDNNVVVCEEYAEWGHHAQQISSAKREDFISTLYVIYLVAVKIGKI